MRPRALATRPALTTLLTLLTMLWLRPAKAQVAAAVDLSGTLGGNEHSFGQAVDARFGYRFGLPRSWHFHAVIIQPELIGGYLHLPALGNARHDEQLGRWGGGLRLGCLCGRIEGFVYGHVGGATGTRGPDWLFDVGTALDWRFSDWSLGIHGAYATLGTRGVHWYQIGPHFEYRWFAW